MSSTKKKILFYFYIRLLQNDRELGEKKKKNSKTTKENIVNDFLSIFLIDHKIKINFLRRINLHEAKRNVLVLFVNKLFLNNKNCNIFVNNIVCFVYSSVIIPSSSLYHVHVNPNVF